MVTKNDITGDSIRSKTTTSNYRDNWDAIYNKAEHKEVQESMKQLKKEAIND